MENRNNAQINHVGYFAKGNVKINLLSTKREILYRRTEKKDGVRARAMRPILYKHQHEILKTELVTWRDGRRQLHWMVQQAS